MSFPSLFTITSNFIQKQTRQLLPSQPPSSHPLFCWKQHHKKWMDCKANNKSIKTFYVHKEFLTIIIYFTIILTFYHHTCAEKHCINTIHTHIMQFTFCLSHFKLYPLLFFFLVRVSRQCFIWYGKNLKFGFQRRRVDSPSYSYIWPCSKKIELGHIYKINSYLFSHPRHTTEHHHNTLYLPPTLVYRFHNTRIIT